MSTNMLYQLKSTIDHEARRKYNQSFLPKLGSQESPKIEDDILTFIETCASFEKMHERDSSERDIYTEFEQQISERELYWQQLRNRNATKSLRNQIKQAGGLEKLLTRQTN